MKLKRTLVTTAVTSLLASFALAQTPPAPAAAPAPAPAPEPAPFSVNIGVASSYIYRGLNQSDFKPALQIGADYAHSSGFYIGTWGSSIRWLKDYGISSGSAEIDLYAGYKGEAGPIAYDVGVLQYFYTGSVAPGATKPDTTELYVAGTFKMFTLKYSHALTNLFGFADSKGSGYLDLSANFDLGDGWSVVPHVGRQWIRHNSAYAYTDYALTVNKDFGNGLSASAALIGTNADKALYTTPAGRFTGRAMLVAGVKYSF